MTQFAFLAADFPALLDHAKRAEAAALSDPRGACFYARLTLETALGWLYATDPALRRPYGDTLAALVAEPSLAALAGPAIVAKARYVKDQGNRAAHDPRPVSPRDAATTVRELFHVCYWIARTYARKTRPDPGLSFDLARLEKTLTISASTVDQVRALRERHDEAVKAQREAEAARAATEEGRAALEAEIARLRAEIAEARRANQAVPDRHDYDEAETRDAFIDLLLHEAGWPLDQPRDREWRVEGLPTPSGEGLVDYVLWGDDGKPLAIVEAKRTKNDARAGQQQGLLYADALERAHGVRPVIFCTNGYEHWLWDDAMYPPRPVAGFLKKGELELLHQRRRSRRPLDDVEVDAGIVNRFYQGRAIRRVGEAFERDRQRAALLVMATGSGKTRTVIALVDQLMRANWVRRVLFLADRRALVKQAQNAFKAHLPATPCANLIEPHDPRRNDHAAARVCLSTYPTMMNLVEERREGVRRFGPGHFDLVVIDEAHRSIYRKYRALFEHFDALLVGLTATPRDEIDRDTYGLFRLERGVPTDAYDLKDAVEDGFLVPFRAVSVPTRFQREGIAYADLSDEEKAAWDALEWDEDGVIPDRVEAADLDRWLYNEDTVDKILAHLMTHGLKVDGGDRLGKTIVFAKNNRHAQFVAERFDANYPHLAGRFARVIDYTVPHAQSLIDAFSEAEREPHIAVSVDMLDTGIDVPEVLNLVFLKPVRSKTKFWQMIGRGTRTCPDLFGPGEDKAGFLIFDCCGNFEFFAANPDRSEAPMSAPLGERLFRTRMDLVGALQDAGTDHAGLAESVKRRLHEEVAGMNVDNFVVRPKRRQVERFQDWDAWGSLDAGARQDLAEHVAGLPSAFRDDALPARQFDLLALTAQLLLLRGDTAFEQARTKIVRVAADLESLANVPAVAEQIAVIQEAQTDEYWRDATPEMVEEVRLGLRDLVQLIEPRHRRIVVTDFTDDIGEGRDVPLDAAGPGVDAGRFRMKVRRFLERHADHLAIQKLRCAQQLTAQDLAELERMMLEEGMDGERLGALGEKGGLGAFLRSLTGLDRKAAKAAFGEVIEGGTATAAQIEFVDLIIDHLVDAGRVEPRRFYESPFTDIHEGGLADVFPPETGRRIVEIVREIDKTAAA